MILTEKQLKVLKKYKIDFNVKTKKDLLINIDWIMTSYLVYDEPTNEYYDIKKIYDEIYQCNDETIDISLEDFISLRIELIFHSGRKIIGTVLGCTSAIDNDGEESIDVVEDETNKVFTIYANEIKEIIIRY